MGAGSKKLSVYLSTNAGKERVINEDSFVINKITKEIKKSSQNLRGSEMPEPLLCGVFDGMGGEKGGFEASDTAALVAVEYFKFLTKSKRSPALSIGEYIKNCNGLIRDYLEKNRMSRGGTTFALAFIQDGAAHTFSMGDSRIYLLRGGRLFRVSRDHTLAQKKLEAGIFTPEEAEKSRESHVLTRFLGMDPDAPDFSAESYPPIKLGKNDRLLLCTDGLYDMISDRQIAGILSREELRPSIALVEAALEHGGKDNVTCMVIDPAGKN